MAKASCLECQTATSLMIHRPAAMTMMMMTMVAMTVIVPVAQPRELLELLAFPCPLWTCAHFRFHPSVCRSVISLDCMVHTHIESKPIPL